MAKNTKKIKKKTRQLAQKNKLRALRKLTAELLTVREKIASIHRRANLIDSAVRRVGREYIMPAGIERPDIDTALSYFRAD